MYLRFRIHFKFVDILKEWEKIKYNQTCLVYLAISNPLFIGSSTLVIFVPFLEFFFSFFYFLSCCFMKFNNRLFPSYDIVVLSKYWQYFQGYFFTKFCFNPRANGEGY